MVNSPLTERGEVGLSVFIPTRLLLRSALITLVESEADLAIRFCCNLPELKIAYQLQHQSNHIQ